MNTRKSLRIENQKKKSIKSNKSKKKVRKISSYAKKTGELVNKKKNLKENKFVYILFIKCLY